MAYTSPTVQGRFTSTGVAKNISIPSGFDWVWVYNETNLYAAGGANSGAKFYFQRGMTSGRGVIYVKEATIGALVPEQIAVNSGFTALDSSDPTQQLTAAVAITATTSAVRPIFATASTAGLSAGAIVRMYNISTGNGINGMDFAVDTIVANTSFRLAGIFANSPVTTTNPATGQWRIVNFDPAFYPPYRYLINALRPQDAGGVANSTIITLSVPSQYKVGQEVTFNIPTGYGMTEMTGRTGTVTAVDDTLATQTVTVNIDSTGFTAFVFPTLNAAGFRAKAIVAPVGIDTAAVLAVNGNILNDAVRNTGIVGVRLLPDTTNAGRSVCGETGDVMYWIAGKSFNVNNL